MLACCLDRSVFIWTVVTFLKLMTCFHWLICLKQISMNIGFIILLQNFVLLLVSFCRTFFFSLRQSIHWSPFFSYFRASSKGCAAFISFLKMYNLRIYLLGWHSFFSPALFVLINVITYPTWVHRSVVLYIVPSNFEIYYFDGTSGFSSSVVQWFGT